MKPMTVWTPTDNERQSILHLHNKPYDGYAILQNPSNTYPLNTVDYRLDQKGMTISNKGDLKGFINFGINESMDDAIYVPADDLTESDDLCSECGGMMYEGECSECGGGMMSEGECSECGGMMYEGECSECGYGGMGESDLDEQMYGQDIHDEEDLDPKAGFDYIEGSSNDVDTFEGMHKNLYKEEDLDEQYDEVDTAYTFKSQGPEGFSKPKNTMGLEDMYQLQQDEFDYASQHDGDPESERMIADLDDEMNQEYGGMEDFDDEKEAYDFRSGGPFGGGAFYNENARKEHNTILEMFQRVSKF